MREREREMIDGQKSDSPNVLSLPRVIRNHLKLR